MIPGQLTELDFPVSPDLAIVRPERVALRFQNYSQRAHIWQVAYLTRKKRIGKSNEWPIYPGSLYRKRCKLIVRLVQLISDLAVTRAWAGPTSASVFASIIWFFDFADERQVGLSVFFDKRHTLAVFSEAVAVSWQQVASGEIVEVTAAHRCQNIQTICRAMYGEEFGRGIIVARQTRGVHVSVPDESAQSVHLSWAEELFSKGAAAVVENQNLPLRIRNVEEEDSNDKYIWYLPNGELARADFAQYRVGPAWNLKKGQVKTFEEVHGEFARLGGVRPKNSARQSLRKAMQSLERANSDARAWARIRLASIASAAFANMFASSCGVNESVLLKLEISPEFVRELRSPPVVRAQFRELKFRASGRVVNVAVGLRLFAYFQQYLALREYMLNGSALNKLFVYVKESGEPVPFHANWFRQKMNAALGHIGYEQRVLGTKKLRAAKQDHLIRTRPVQVAADAMGHSIGTAIRAYSNGSQSRNIEEMTTYLRSVQVVVLKSRRSINDQLPSNVGGCRSFNNPSPLVPDAPVAPDCHSDEGCLFCRQLRIHADELDVRKLSSCRYVLQQTFSTKSSIDFSERVLTPTLHRIEELLAEVEKLKPGLVKRIANEVEVEGKLDSYWLNMLEMLVGIGVI